MRVQIKGVASATKKLADGTRVTYYYAWRGDFIKSYNDAVATRRLGPSGLLNGWIDEYQETTEFRDLSERSKKEYRRHIKRIRTKFGSMPLAAVEDKRARGTFKTWRDELAENTPRESILIYQHFAREERSHFVERIGRSLKDLMPNSSIWAFCTAHMVFFLVINPRHASILEKRVAAQALVLQTLDFASKPANRPHARDHRLVSHVLSAQLRRIRPRQVPPPTSCG